MASALSRPALAILLLAACATPYQPFEGRPVLAEIKFEGNKSISEGDLLNHIATAPTSGFWSKTARYYDPDLFAIDLKRIVRWYNAKGFYKASVLQVEEKTDDKGRVTLVVKIDEGPRAFVRKVDYVGLDELPKDELKDVDDRLPLHPGDGFDEDQYEKSKEVLVQQLRERGFAQARTKGRVEVAPDEGRATITYEAEPGPRFSFGKVNVTGNRRVDASDIEFATGISRGDRFSPQALALAQQRVYNLGAFSGVRVGLEPLGDTPVAAVRVNVREAPFQTIRLGLGASAEVGRWVLPRLTADYTNRSLLGGLRRLELSTSIGYAFVPNLYQYEPSQSGIVNQSSAQITIPSVFFPGLDWITRGEFGREIQQGFSYDNVAGRTGLLYRRGPHAVGGSLNFVQYFHVSVNGTGNIDPNSPQASILRECTQGCLLTYPELRYAYDGRDNLIEPTQGFYFSVGFQQTVPPGDFNYFRVNPEIRAYAPMTRLAVFAARALYGGMFTEGNSLTPFTQRFYFGGQNDQRGYGALRQGPKLGANPCDPDPQKDQFAKGCTQPFATEATPKGGTSAMLFSGEFRIRANWPVNNVSIVPFMDASTIGTSPERPLRDGLEVAVGLGLRYLTPFGPIRADVGYLLNPRRIETEEVQDANHVTTIAKTPVSFHCPSNQQFGCISESRWALHVTLGEAF